MAPHRVVDVPASELPDYSAAVSTYCDGVLSGTITAGREQRLAVLRHVRDLQSAGARGLVFHATLASFAIWFIETCCVHTKTSIGAKAGDPLILTDSQRFIVWSLIGWRRKDGHRRFRKAHIEVARKFGKSTFAAALLLLLLVFDFPADPSAELYCCATKELQARIVFREAQKMARKSPWLKKRLKLTAKAIILESVESTITPLGSDSDTTDGLNPSVIIKDELHAWQKRHRGLHEKLETGDGSRMQPLTISITTSGDDRAEIWSEERAWAVRCVESVLSGEIVDDTVFAFVCCIDVVEHACPLCGGSGKQRRRKCGGCVAGVVAADDPFDPECWSKANPNLGQSVGIDRYEQHARRAEKDPTYLNTFLRYYCNVKTSRAEKAIPPELWAGNSGKPFVQPQQFCRGAFDLGRSDDFSAWALVFPTIVDELDAEKMPIRTYDILSRSYTCEARAETLMTEQMERWIKDGRLIVHPGDQVDFDQIERDIVEISGKYQVISWGFDQTFAPHTAQRLLNVYGIPCHKFAQAPSWYNPGIRELLKALRRRDVSHGGDPCLAWQADNLVIVRDAKDLWMPDKSGSAFKIDAMVAVLMALADILHHSADDDSRVSVYESRGLRTI